MTARAQIRPVAEALLSIDERTPVGSMLRSAEWATLPVELRNRAQFSAGVESARVLNRIQGGMRSIVGHIEESGGVIADRSKLIADIGRIAEREGLRPSDPALRGTLRDIGSERRAELIYETQAGMAYGRAEWKAGQDEEALYGSPCWELVRVREAKVERDWLEPNGRWARAAGAVDADALRVFRETKRMVARKTSPIWVEISAFGNPWPPFDFGSGMWVEDVSRGEALDLGAILPGEEQSPAVEAWEDSLEASVRELSPEMREALREHFGDQVEIDGEHAVWKGGVSEYERARTDQRKSAESVFAGSEAGFRGDRLGDLRGETAPAVFEAAAELERRNAVEIAAVASGRKPLFHEQLGAQATPELARKIQRRLPPGVIARAEAGHLYVYRPDLAERFLEKGKPVFAQIHQKTLAGENGLLLGYGQERMLEPGAVRVAIFDDAGRPVSGFRARPETARLYGAARARDFVEATGMPHNYEVIE